MEKITFDKLYKIMNTYNTRFPENAENMNLHGVIVYHKDNWEHEYSETERSYRVYNNNRMFQNGKIANSLFGNCLDGKDMGVRLDWYNWAIDYCYME